MNSSETIALSTMGKNNPKLTLHDKKQIALDWFTDPEGTDIGKFCVHMKHAPQARRFVRLVADKLDLLSLRKLRNENPNIDESVKESIMGFTIPNNEGNNKKEMLPDVDSMKKVLIDFFEDESMNRALPFIRKNSAFRKDEIRIFLCFVKKMKLRRLRKERDEPGIRSKVMAAVDERVGVESMVSELQNMNLRDKSNKKGQVAVMEPTQMKEILIEWFDHDNLPPISRFLRSKGLLNHRCAMTNVILTLKLHKLRYVRDEPGMREKVLDEIDSFFLKNPTMSRASDNVGRPFNKQERAFLSSPTAVQTLLKEWYDDEQMLSIVAFLQKKGKPEIRRCVAHLVNEANGLRKLKKHRKNLGFRERAMKAIDVIVSKKGTQVAPNIVKNAGNDTIGIIPSASEDMVKKIIFEWFEDEQIRPLNTILHQHGHKEVSASVIALVKSNRLIKLRNKRDEPRSKKLARRKIESIFMPSVAFKQKTGSGQSIIIPRNQQSEDGLRDNAIKNMDAEVSDVEATTESLVKPFGAFLLGDDRENYVAVDHPKGEESSEDDFQILS